MLDIAEAGERMRIIISNVVLAEVRPKPEYDVKRLGRINELFDADRPYIRFYGVSRSIANSARELGLKHGITVLDAIHVATALEAEVSSLFTWDGDRDIGAKTKRSDLLKYNGLIGNPALSITTPSTTFDRPMDDAVRRLDELPPAATSLVIPSPATRRCSDRVTCPRRMRAAVACCQPYGSSHQLLDPPVTRGVGLAPREVG